MHCTGREQACEGGLSTTMYIRYYSGVFALHADIDHSTSTSFAFPCGLMRSGILLPYRLHVVSRIDEARDLHFRSAKPAGLALGQ